MFPSWSAKYEMRNESKSHLTIHLSNRMYCTSRCIAIYSQSTCNTTTKLFHVHYHHILIDSHNFVILTGNGQLVEFIGILTVCNDCWRDAWVEYSMNSVAYIIPKHGFYGINRLQHMFCRIVVWQLVNMQIRASHNMQCIRNLYEL